MNPFLVFPVPAGLPPVPKRLYARLDDFSWQEKTGRLRTLFGATDGDWFDKNGPLLAQQRLALRAATIEKMPTFLLDSELSNPWVPPGFASDFLLTFFETAWVEILIQPGGDARLYRNLYGDGDPVSVIRARLLSTQEALLLNQAHDLDEWTEGDSSILALLNGHSATVIESLGVYDVGQGSAVGLSDAAHKPLLYFDFGGGVAFHVGTRPHAVPSLCLCANPLIVMSHWDADHWSSGPLVSGAISRDWIAPYQTVSTPHLVFAASISPGKLHVSRAPAGTSFSFGNVTVTRAAGLTRNDSGFWLRVDSRNGHEPYLMPADADYRHLGVNAPSVAAGLSATHHGGNWHSKIAPPKSSGTGRQRAVFNYGIFSSTKSNFYGHPTHRSITDHATSGFVRIDTTSRAFSFSGNGTGHVYLDWAGASISRAPCGSNRCYQNFDQA